MVQNAFLAGAWLDSHDSASDGAVRPGITRNVLDASRADAAWCGSIDWPRACRRECWSSSSRSIPAAASRIASAWPWSTEAERRGWLQPGRHDHRGHGRQHRRRAGPGGGGQGLSLHLRPARQDERREDPPAQGLRRRDRDHADRRRRPTRPRATTASPTGWPARSPAPGGPTSSPTWPTPRSTIERPARRSGSRPAGGSRRSSRASAPAARSRASAATSRSKTPTIRVIGADPEGSVLSGDAPRPWKVEGIGEDFVPKTLNGQVVDEWIRDRRRRELPHRAGAGPARGDARGRLARHGRRGRAASTPGGSPPRTSWSPSAPTPAAII